MIYIYIYIYPQGHQADFVCGASSPSKRQFFRENFLLDLRSKAGAKEVVDAMLTPESQSLDTDSPV